MPKQTFFTTVTPLPSCVTRDIVMDMLHSYTDMIDLNPIVEERHTISPPPNATAEEYHCQWYSLTDRVQYLPGGIISSKVSYTACFHSLPNGLQAHFYPPLGVIIKNKWTLCGSLPGEAMAPIEIGVGAPLTGLYIREDVKISCNFMATSYIKKSVKKIHASLLSRLVARAQFLNVRPTCTSLDYGTTGLQQDFEPIEFGRDGQNTQEIAPQPALINPRVSSLSRFEISRPNTAYCDSIRKLSLIPNTSSLSLPRALDPERTRAHSIVSPLASSNPWQKTESICSSPGSSPSFLRNEPSQENICFELDAQESVLGNEANKCWEMGTENEIKRNLLHAVQRKNSLHKPIVIEPIELEG